MVLQAHLTEEAGLPRRILGLRCAGWRKTDIEKILNHYDTPRPRGPCAKYSNTELLVMLNDLVMARGLNNRDKRHILRQSASVTAATSPQLVRSHTASSEASSDTALASDPPTSKTISLPLNSIDARQSVTETPQARRQYEGLVARRGPRQLLYLRRYEERNARLLLYQNRRTERRDRGRYANRVVLEGIPASKAARTLSTDHANSSTNNGSNDIGPECMACLETLTAVVTPTRRITEACNHDPLICLNCLAQSISSQIDSKIWSQIDCPTCKARLNYDDIKAFATDPVFQR